MARRNIFGLFGKKETYRVSKRKASKKGMSAEEKEHLRAMKEHHTDIQSSYSFSEGQYAKRVGRQARPTDSVLEGTKKYLGVQRAKALARREYMRGFRESNPSKRSKQSLKKGVRGTVRLVGKGKNLRLEIYT